MNVVRAVPAKNGVPVRIAARGKSEARAKTVRPPVVRIRGSWPPRNNVWLT